MNCRNCNLHVRVGDGYVCSLRIIAEWIKRVGWKLVEEYSEKEER